MFSHMKEAHPRLVTYTVQVWVISALCAQTHARLIPSHAAHSAQELLQAQTQKAAKAQGIPLGKRTAESKGAAQNYV